MTHAHATFAPFATFFVSGISVPNASASEVDTS